VRHFVQLVGPDGVRALEHAVVACIGPVTADTARELGMSVGVCPAAYTAPALAAALVEHFCKATRDRVSPEGR
jgi:uroporphyrinogen III methyltransferase/synthase